MRLLRCVQERATVRGNASPPALLQRKLLTFRDADHEALTRQGIPTDLTFKEVPAQVGVSQASNYDCKTSGLATSGATGCAVLIGRKGRRLTMAHSPAQVNSTDWGGMEVLVESDARDELYVVYGTEYKDCVSTAVAHPANQAALKHETLTPTYVYDAAWVAIARRGETTFLLTSHNGVQQPV